MNDIFWLPLFLFFPFEDEKRNAFIKSIPVFRPKQLKNHTLWDGTYLYILYGGFVLSEVDLWWQIIWTVGYKVAACQHILTMDWEPPPHCQTLQMEPHYSSSNKLHVSAVTDLPESFEVDHQHIWQSPQAQFLDCSLLKFLALWTKPSIFRAQLEM